MLDGAAAECRRRAAANRQSIKARFTGQRRRDELHAARRQAEADLQSTLAAIRLNYGALKGVRRRRKRAGALAMT
jgi:hypothetical protein